MIPAENGKVCPGGKLQFMCSAVAEVSWQIDGSSPFTLEGNMEVNLTEIIKGFSLVLTAKTTTDTGIKINSTATNDMVTSNLDGQQVVCYSGASHDTLYVQVAGTCVAVL